MVHQNHEELILNTLNCISIFVFVQVRLTFGIVRER